MELPREQRAVTLAWQPHLMCTKCKKSFSMQEFQNAYKQWKVEDRDIVYKNLQHAVCYHTSTVMEMKDGTNQSDVSVPGEH